jgi:hypothetical protein
VLICPECGHEVSQHSKFGCLYFRGRVECPCTYDAIEEAILRDILSREPDIDPDELRAYRVKHGLMRTRPPIIHEEP